MNLDQKIATKLFKMHGKNKFRDAFFVFGARWWIGIHLFLSFLFYIAEDYSGPVVDPHWWLTLFAFPIITAWVLALIVQYLIKRKRPYVKLEKEPLFKPLFETPSFPSAHTAMAMAPLIAPLFFIGDLMPFQMIGAIFLLISAIYVAFSRMYIGVHYLSDVIIGTIVAIMVVFVPEFF